MAGKKSLLDRIANFVGVTRDEDQSFREDVPRSSLNTGRRRTTITPDSVQAGQQYRPNRERPSTSRFDSASDYRETDEDYRGRSSSMRGDRDDYGRGRDYDRRDSYERDFDRDDREEGLSRSQDPRTAGRYAGGSRRNAQPETGYRRNESDSALRTRSKDGHNAEIIVAYVAMVEDVKPLINALVRGYTILLTLDTSDMVTRQRIVDTMYGAAFALGATFNKASHSNLTFIIAPRGTNLLKYKEFTD